MGTWGVKIFQSDDASDIRESYREQIIVGKSDLEVEEAIIQEFGEDPEEMFWLPLAVTEWKVGRLSERVREKAIDAIDRELNCLSEYWKESLIPKRKIELLHAKELLCSAMPARKKLRMPSWAWKCPWQLGSVLQYKMAAQQDNNPLLNEYVLLQIVGISETPSGKIPCEGIAVSLYDWHSPESPIDNIVKLMENPPQLVPLITLNGTRTRAHCIVVLPHMMSENDLKCVSEKPLTGFCGIPEPVYGPANVTLESHIIRTLTRGQTQGDGS